jgi:beta-lactamase superfamily II metal-dependent hydrolase
MAHAFVRFKKKGQEDKKYKKIYLQTYDAKKKKLKDTREVFWGDYLRYDEDADTSFLGNGFLQVNWISAGKKTEYYIHEDYTSKDRPLEIIFLDVGQGDGAILISPESGGEEHVMVMDAGEFGNMHAFLKARFPYRRGKFNHAIITHPDKDHYLGFQDIFDDKYMGFDTIYQNGLVERPVSGKFEKVGGLTKDPDNGKFYIYDLAEDRNYIEKYFSDKSTLGRYVFPKLMYAALNNPNIGDFKTLSIHPDHCTFENGRSYMPGFAPSDGREYQIEVLGPVVEEDKNGKKRLERIDSNYGKTKNGHSVLLRLQYGQFKIFFGGDLNTRAEKFLLQHYAKLNSFPRSEAKKQQMIEDARQWFESDVMKVCHHGASDVTDEFMAAVNPACFVISSGDEEGHVHPKPDLLGRLGKMGRGESPVILSTELQRSTRAYDGKDKIEELKNMINNIKVGERFGLDTKVRQEIIGKIKDLGKNVETYGAIYLKTDGKTLVTAFKIEQVSLKKRWFHFEYAMNEKTGEILLKKKK